MKPRTPEEKANAFFASMNMEFEDEFDQEACVKKLDQALTEAREEALEEAAKRVEQLQHYWADNDRVTNAYYNLTEAQRVIRTLKEKA
jgi:hypothetical protein